MLSYGLAEILYQIHQPGNEHIQQHVERVVGTLESTQWNHVPGEMRELVLYIMALAQEPSTLVEFIGKVGVRLETDNPGIKATEYIMLLAQEDILNIEIDSIIRVSCTYSFDVPEYDKHVVLRTGDICAIEVQDYNYGHMILGGYLKQSCYTNEDNICLEHLERVNSTELSLNIALLRIYSMLPSENQKGTPEFREFRDKLYQHYVDITKEGNHFHIVHKYDNRGRCYANSYYANYQGNDFQKAVVQLANKEIIGS